MQRKNIFFVLIATGMLLVVSTALWLSTAGPVKAQCGSQASSCKNCHEVQGQKPVNNDGTGWHQSHAFGDFCYLCHAGNQQAASKDAAHVGMVAPLSDIKGACASCHVKDSMDRAKVYADKLGVAIGASTAGTASTAAPAGTPQATSAPSNPPSGGSAVVVENQPVTDYVEQYNESVLGQVSINWGNVIVAVMIVILAIGGGTLIFLNERKLRGGQASEPRKSAPGAAEALRIEDLPEDLVTLLPRLKQLTPVGRKALGKLLVNPESASDLLLSLSRLDPDLLKRMQGLDREAQALMIALSGD